VKEIDIIADVVMILYIIKYCAGLCYVGSFCVGKVLDYFQKIIMIIISRQSDLQQGRPVTYKHAIKQ